jgi:hypothetical protein
LRRLHNHAFYLFSVVVGLAIREVLARTGPDLFLPNHAERWQVHLEALRLITFLLTIGCFYFGAGVYFDKTHINRETECHYAKKNYGLDFAAGLIHFLAFFAWAITINDFSRTPKWGISPFWGFLTVVITYDVAWLIANLKYDTVQEIKLWALGCVVAFFFSSAVFVILKFVFLTDPVVAEEWCFVPYWLYLCGDLTELFTGRPFFLDLIKKLLPKA